jgi:hypothetical protein
MRRLSLAAVLLIACFALAGCATDDKRSGDNRYSGWYSGLGGTTLP